MLVGAAQIDITPSPGVELSGFAARRQPSTGIRDGLFARALYLEDGDEKLLWLHADLVAVERPFVLEFRERVGNRLGILPARILISATHTHSGPSTVHLTEAGTYDPPYVAWLAVRLEEVARKALAQKVECEVVAVEGQLNLAVDRRKKASAHTDPRVGAIGWRRPDGQFAAVVVNYAMHAVCGGPTNREISADWPGWTARALSDDLPGKPIVLATNGACGNLNPPAENVPAGQIEAWGGQVSDAVLDLLKRATLSDPAAVTSTRPEPASVKPVNSNKGSDLLRVMSCNVPLPMDVLTVEQINATADRALTDPAGLSEWGEKYRRAIATWRRVMTETVTLGRATPTQDVELFAIRIGPVVCLGVGAEVFSRFTDFVRQQSGRTVYTIGYANGDIGYLPPAAAYDEGGYEVTSAHLFYNAWRVSRGGLELLSEKAADLIRSL